MTLIWSFVFWQPINFTWSCLEVTLNYQIHWVHYQIGFLWVAINPQGHREHYLLSTVLPEMHPNPSKPCQEPTCPYAYPVGVVEDRSVLMGVPDGFNGPTGSQGTIVVKHSPPRNASKPLQTLSGTYLSLCLPYWSRGGQECPGGVSWWFQWTHRVIGNNSC